MLKNQFTLTLLDATGIQDYIFSSNRLQENIGASEIVYRATTLWAFEALEKAGVKNHNVKDGGSLNWSFDESKWIEKDENLQAEVIQAAGGNTVILFREPSQSREFVRKLTLHTLKEAPGLTILAQHLDGFVFSDENGHDKDNLFEARGKLQDMMREHKRSRGVSTARLGMSVTAVCDSTGLPAVNTLAGTITVNGKSEPIGLDGEDKTKLVSSEAAAKRSWRKAANNRLNAMLRSEANGYHFPYDLEKIGRDKGEESYIAVVHIDGNRMGKRVLDVGKNSANNREFIQNLRDLSRKINSISQFALKAIVGLVVQAVEKQDIPIADAKDEDGEKDREDKEIYRKYLPFRPLVFGGDDVTFVCNGMIGVSLAAAYLKIFEKEAERETQKLKDFHASAGISIVKMHYPFARAYKLAEELTASAKLKVHELFPEKEDGEYQEGEQRDCSALDWHFAQSGLSGSLEIIRKRDYYSTDGKPLYLRPVTLGVGETSWKKIHGVIMEFKEKWSDKHNKVIGLREPLRKGADASQKYIHDFELYTDKIKLPEIVGGDDAKKTGWLKDVCYYFDAIELLDHYVPLEQEEK